MTDKPIIQLEKKDGHDAPWVPVGEPKPAPMSNEHLDRAIVVARNATRDAYNMATEPDEFREADVKYARALIRELFTNLQPPADATDYERDMWEDTLATILRAAGLEGEG